MPFQVVLDDHRRADVDVGLGGYTYVKGVKQRRVHIHVEIRYIGPLPIEVIETINQDDGSVTIVLGIADP